jgi:hypothetical protein
VRLTFIDKYFNLTIMVWFANCSLILFLGATTPTRAQDISSIKSMLEAKPKQCPPTTYRSIYYGDAGCGDRSLSTLQGEQCQNRVDADNKIIDEANRLYQECQKQLSDTNQSSTGNRPKNGNSSNLPSQNNSGSSDLASRLAAQQSRNATADDVRREQDQQFSETVRSTQQEYQQYKAQEQQAATDRALNACQHDYNADLRECAGNTEEYYKEGRFPAGWVSLVDSACRSRAIARNKSCRADLTGDPYAGMYRQDIARTEAGYQNAVNSLPAYAGQQQEAISGPSYTPGYSAPRSQQGRVTTAPFPQMPAVNPNIPSPVQPRSSRGSEVLAPGGN